MKDIDFDKKFEQAAKENREGRLVLLAAVAMICSTLIVIFA